MGCDSFSGSTGLAEDFVLNEASCFSSGRHMLYAFAEAPMLLNAMRDNANRDISRVLADLIRTGIERLLVADMSSGQET
jgi:hypothetical protein